MQLNLSLSEILNNFCSWRKCVCEQLCYRVLLGAGSKLFLFIS